MNCIVFNATLNPNQPTKEDAVVHIKWRKLMKDIALYSRSE